MAELQKLDDLSTVSRMSLKHAVVKVCDVIAPLAFLAAALSLFLPFVTFNFPGAPVDYSGIGLIFRKYAGGGPEHVKMLNELARIWRPDMILTAIFAAGGALSVLVRLFGSTAKKALFEKLEIGIGVLGAMCMGAMVSGAADMAIRKEHILIYHYGLWAVAGSYLVALVAALLGFFLEFPGGGEYKVGTLRYNNKTLMQVFFWVIWGDFCYTLMDMVVPSILPLQLDQLGISPFGMALLFSAAPSALNMLVVPVISYKSDRTRSRWGRRIPYMVVTAPFMCIFLVALGYTKEIGQWLAAHQAFFESHGIDQTTMLLLVIGLVVVAFQFFYDFVGSVYWYLFADVVPENTIGRFMGLFRLIGGLAGYIFNTFIFKYAESHTAHIYWGGALLYFFGFGLMCWKVKEGEYPPVDDEQPGRKSVWRGISNYFRECFTNPLYLFLFFFNMSLAFAGACSMFRIFFFKETAGLTLNEIGNVAAWGGIIGLVLTYPSGMVVDYFKPLRTMVVIYAIAVPLALLGFFIRDFNSFVIYNLIMLPVGMIYEAATMPVMIQILPRDKYGQFSSANSILRSVARMIAPLAGAAFISMMASEATVIKPGDIVRVSCRDQKWVVDRDSEEIAQLRQSIEKKTDSADGKTQLLKIAEKTSLSLAPDGPKLLTLEPVGDVQRCELPGFNERYVGGVWFIANVAATGDISLCTRNWRYLWVWQFVFNCVSMACLVGVLILWRRSERAKQAAGPAA